MKERCLRLGLVPRAYHATSCARDLLSGMPRLWTPKRSDCSRGLPGRRIEHEEIPCPLSLASERPGHAISSLDVRQARLVSRIIIDDRDVVDVSRASYVTAVDNA